MNGNNLGNIDLIFRDARGGFLTDVVTLEFRNMELASLNFKRTVQLQGEIQELKEVPAFPHGVWAVTILPQKYRFKQIFVDVPANGTATISETFFVDPAKVTPVFPKPDRFQNDPRWQPLMAHINSGLFGGLNNEQKAGLLNLFAKMSHPSAVNVFDQVIDIFQVEPARFLLRSNLVSCPMCAGCLTGFMRCQVICTISPKNPKNGSGSQITEASKRQILQAIFS